LRKTYLMKEGKRIRRLEMNSGKRGFKSALAVLALAAILGVAACGGGGGSIAGGGIGGTGKSIGVISAAGPDSVDVNGVQFSTTGAIVFIDDSASSASSLEVGMVATVDGDFSDDGITGSAITIVSDDLVEGPVTSAVDASTRTFSVMKQVVFYSATTIFKNTGDLGGGSIAPTELSLDNVVEVSGFFDGAGQLRATRVERKVLSYAGTEILEVKGKVANLNTTNQTFAIGALDISYFATTTSFDDGTVADLAEGRLVEVKGNDNPSDGLEADSIEFEDTFPGAAGDLLEFEGYVTSTSSTAGDFEVNGLPVVTSGQTQWRGGYTALGDVSLDDRVEVEGRLEDQAGTTVLVAREVELEIEEDVKVEAYIDAVNVSGQSFTILGIGFVYDSVTEFEDKSGGLDPFTASDIDATAPSTDWLWVRGYIGSDGTITTTEVERDNDDADPDRIIVQGPAADVPASPGSFTILGIVIDIGSIQDYKIEDSISNETDFFNALTNGRVVKARGSHSAGTLTVEELDLQN
jgi:hypothetical protein